MGSGSGGGGGSGSGGSGGGGGGGGYGSGVRFGGGGAAPVPVAPDKVEDEVTDLLKELPKEYVDKLFCNPLIRASYEQLFRLSVEIFQNKSWEGVSRHYGVEDGPGCLVRWCRAVIARFQKEEPNKKAREIARFCLEDFLMFALENDYKMFLSGSSKDVIGKLRRKVFDSTSGYFLGFMIRRIVERQREKLTESREKHLREAAQKKADRIVKSFENKFRVKDQITHRDLFRVICENPDWFTEQLRKKREQQPVAA